MHPIDLGPQGISEAVVAARHTAEFWRRTLKYSWDVKKSSLSFIFLKSFFLQLGPENALPSLVFFCLAFEKIKSSFLFFLWAEAQTRKAVWVKSSLGRAFWRKFGLQNGTHVFFFFRLGLVRKWDAHVGVRKNPALG